MTIKKILLLGDPVLRGRAREVDCFGTFELVNLEHDLWDTLSEAKRVTGYGRGLAAPQIGVPARAIYINVPGREPLFLLNPVLVSHSAQKIEVWDSCFSFPGVFMRVTRYRQCLVDYQDLNGKRHELHAEDESLSELLQHEIDHLDGVMCTDRMIDSLTLCTREEFEKRYRQNTPY